MRKYHIGVDVTRSIYVDVEATTEEEAMQIAKEKAEDLLHTSKGAFVDSVVHWMDDITEDKTADELTSLNKSLLFYSSGFKPAGGKK